MTLYPDPLLRYALYLCGGYLVICVPCFIVLLAAMALGRDE